MNRERRVCLAPPIVISGEFDHLDGTIGKQPEGPWRGTANQA